MNVIQETARPSVNASLILRQSSLARPANHTPAPQQPKLLDRLREALRSRHYSRRTEQCYCHWVKRFIFFHHVRHPAQMAEPEINAFLTHLAVKETVSASTQNQKDVKTTMIYTHVLNRGGLGVRSPVDAL